MAAHVRGLDRLARDLVAEVLAESPREVERLAPALDAGVFRVGCPPDGSVVVKLVTTQIRPRVDLRRTAVAMARAASAGVPVAAVLGTGVAEDQQYLIMEHLDGVPWREVRPRLSGPALATAYADLAQALTALHTLRFDSFGELDSEGRTSGAGLLEALHRRADLRVPDPADRDRFHRLLDRDAALFGEPEPPTLSHDDLHHRNVLFRHEGGRWRLVGILDWDKCWAGPAESDLARMIFWDDMTGPGFWSTYRAPVPVDGYPERRLIYQLLWCLEYPSNSVRHRADRAALSRRLRFDSC